MAVAIRSIKNAHLQLTLFYDSHMKDELSVINFLHDEFFIWCLAKAYQNDFLLQSRFGCEWLSRKFYMKCRVLLITISNSMLLLSKISVFLETVYLRFDRNQKYKHDSKFKIGKFRIEFAIKLLIVIYFVLV